MWKIKNGAIDLEKAKKSHILYIKQDKLLK